MKPIHLKEVVLEFLNPDEIEDVLHYVDVHEQAGELSHEEAADWRSCIRAWHEEHDLQPQD